MRDAALPLPLPPPGPHPMPAVLHRASSGPRSAEALRALEHLALCAECSEEKLRRESFDNPEPLSARRVQKAWSRFGRAPARFSARPALAAAAAVVVALLGGALWLAREPAGDPFRGRPASIEPVSPSGILEAPPQEFGFSRRRTRAESPVRVTVFDASQTYIWTSEATRANRVLFPRQERERLRTGTDYFWTILTDEEAVPAKSFHLQPPP